MKKSLKYMKKTHKKNSKKLQKFKKTLKYKKNTKKTRKNKYKKYLGGMRVKNISTGEIRNEEDDYILQEGEEAGEEAFDECDICLGDETAPRNLTGKSPVCCKISLRRKEKLQAQLMDAATNGNIKLVNELIIAGADVNANDNNGVTALMVASREGHTSCIEMLVARGADVNAKNDSGMTALMYASQNEHSEAVKFLKESGAVEIEEEKK